MKLRNPFLIRLLGFLGAWLIRLWMGTLNYRMYTSGNTKHPADVRDQRYLYCLWHETILYPTIFQTKIHVLISQHADGELISQACRHLGFSTVRGSSTRGGSQALLQLLHISRKTHLLVTPDGPRGPRRRVQLGLIFLASQTGLPIVPCGVGFEQCWRANSWDRFAVPVPWTKTCSVVGTPISVPPKLNRKQMEVYRARVEDEMDRLTSMAECWAKDGVRPRIPSSKSDFRKVA